MSFQIFLVYLKKKSVIIFIFKRKIFNSYNADMVENNHMEIQSENNSDSIIKGNLQEIFNNGTATITRYIHIKHADSSVKIFRETTV